MYSFYHTPGSLPNEHNAVVVRDKAYWTELFLFTILRILQRTFASRVGDASENSYIIQLTAIHSIHDPVLRLKQQWRTLAFSCVYTHSCDLHTYM